MIVRLDVLDGDDPCEYCGDGGCYQMEILYVKDESIQFSTRSTRKYISPE